MSRIQNFTAAILRQDDANLVTDRWGNAIDDEDAPQALLDAMWDEVSFVARRDGRLGLLIEVELIHPGGEDPEADVLAAYGTLDPAVVDARLLADAERLALRFPSAEFYVLCGPEVCMGRAALRAFVSEGSCSAELSKAIGTALLAPVAPACGSAVEG